MRAIVLILIMAAVAAGQPPVRSCESLKMAVFPDTTIEAAVVEPAASGRPEFCRVTAVVTHPPADDRIIVWIGLPVTGWNGRFEGVGGGGFSGGNPNGVVGPVAQGY